MDKEWPTVFALYQLEVSAIQRVKNFAPRVILATYKSLVCEQSEILASTSTEAEDIKLLGNPLHAAGATFADRHQLSTQIEKLK